MGRAQGDMSYGGSTGLLLLAGQALAVEVAPAPDMALQSLMG